MFYETGEDGLGHRASGLKHSPLNRDFPLA